MIYCDTSLLVAFLTNEVHTATAQSWYVAQSPVSCAISAWTLTEVASALAGKQRGGALSAESRQETEAAWVRLQSEMIFIDVQPDHFRQAVGLVDVLPSGLRAGDALHLAIAIDHGCALATFDRDLADAARARGIVVHPA